MAFLHQLVAIVRKIVQILRSRPRRIALKTRQTMANVGCVADLALLPIAGDVDTAFLLKTDHVIHRALHGRFKDRRVERFLAVLRKNKVHYVLRPRQAADVRGKNAVRTQLHG